MQLSVRPRFPCCVFPPPPAAVNNNFLFGGRSSCRIVRCSCIAPVTFWTRLAP